MRQLVAFLILFSFVMPARVHAGIGRELDAVEKELLTPQNTENRRMNEDFARELKKPSGPPKAKEQKSGTAWWKWALGLAIVGGAAVAANGHDEGGSSSGGSTGSETISW